MNKETDNLEDTQKPLSGAKRRFILKYEYHYTKHLKPAQNVYVRVPRGKPSNPTALASIGLYASEED